MQAEKCTADTVEIVDTFGWNFMVKARPTGRFGETWIEDFLGASDFLISPSGAYQLDFVMPPEKKTFVDENGDESLLNAVSIFLIFKQAPELAPVQMELILDLDKRGVEQLLYFGFPDHQQYFLKKWGLL